MIRLLHLLIAALFLTCAVQAAEKKSTPARRPNQTSASDTVVIDIVYGEQDSRIELLRTQGKPEEAGQLKFTSPMAAPKEKSLTAENYNYLKTKIEKISGPFSQKTDCPRSYATISLKDRKVSGCLTQSLPGDRRVQDLLQLLNLVF